MGSFSDAFVNGARVGSRVRQNRIQDKEIKRKKDLNNAFNDVRNAVISGAIPPQNKSAQSTVAQPNTPPPNTPPSGQPQTGIPVGQQTDPQSQDAQDASLPQTRDWQEYIQHKLGAFTASPAEMNTLTDNINNQLRGQFERNGASAVRAIEAGDLDAAGKFLKTAYSFLPNNVYLNTMVSPNGLVVRGRLESDDERGKKGQPTGATVITNPQQLKDMLKSIQERPELFNGLSIAAQQAQSNLMKTRADIRGTDARTRGSIASAKTIEATNKVLDTPDKATGRTLRQAGVEIDQDYKKALTENARENTSLAPAKVAIQRLALENQYQTNLIKLNSMFSKGAGWKTAEFNSFMKGATTLNTANTAKYKAGLAKLDQTYGKNSMDMVKQGVPPSEDWDDEQNMRYAKAKEEFRQLSDQHLKDTLQYSSALRNASAFMQAGNPPPSQGGPTTADIGNIMSVVDRLNDPNSIQDQYARAAIVNGIHTIHFKLEGNAGAAFRYETTPDGRRVPVFTMGTIVAGKDKEGKPTSKFTDNGRVIYLPRGVIAAFSQLLPSQDIPAGVEPSTGRNAIPAQRTATDTRTVAQ